MSTKLKYVDLNNNLTDTNARL